MRSVKQGAAANVMLLMVGSTDHVTGKTTLTLAVTLSKDGAGFGSISPTVTERGTGWYNVALVTGDTGTLGDLVVRATATGADPAERVLVVVAYDPADAAALGLSRLDATITSRPAATDYTSGRAAKLDNLDVAVGTRAIEKHSTIS